MDSKHIPFSEMGKGSTVVNFVLDKSGSMLAVKDATIAGFNEYITSLKNDGIKYRFSLTMFDTAVEKYWIGVPVEFVKELDADSYQPNGGTALYDAVCKSIDDLEKSIATNDKVLMVIMTDGEENSSREYTQAQFKARVERLQATGRWSFVFMGANQDAWGNAQQWGFYRGNVTIFNSTSTGTSAAFTVTSLNTRNFANSADTSTNSFFSEEDKTTLSSSL